jgi:aspartate/methionine/tyrosine aminotransferase
LITFAERHGLWLVSDEIWADIAFDQPTVSLMDRQTKTFAKKIVVSGLSKNFGLAGLRIGYVVCPDEQTYATVYQASQHASTAFGISSLSQVAGTAALNHAGEWKRAFLVHLKRMRSLVSDFCDQFPYFELSSVPDATYLVFPRLVHTTLSPEEFVAKLQQEARVALVPGGKSWFESDSDHHVRICYATSEAILSEAFRRMLDWSAQNGV